MTGDSLPSMPQEGAATLEGDGFFVLRPEVMRHLPVNVYEGDLEQALQQYASADGREQVFKQLVSDKHAQESLRQAYPDFDMDRFSADLNDLGVLLDKQKEYYSDIVELLKTRQRFFRETVPGEYSLPDSDIAPSGGDLEGAPDESAIRRTGERASESQQEQKGIFRRAWDSIRNFPKNHPFVTTLLALAAAAWGISKLWGMLAGLVPVPNFSPAVGEVLNKLGPTGAAGQMLEGSGLGGLIGPKVGGPGM